MNVDKVSSEESSSEDDCSENTASTYYSTNQTGTDNLNIFSVPNKHCKKDFEIVIIGAGISGLSAAKTLTENEKTDFIILEAQNYIGGRIKSEPHDGAFIELGAQWIHGSRSKLKKFADKYNLISNEKSYEGEGLYLRNDGYEYSEELWEKVENVFNDILKKVDKFAESETKHNFSVGEFLQTEFDKYVAKNIHSETEKQQWYEIYEWNLRTNEVDNASSSLNVLSADAWGLYEYDGEGPDLINLKNGYSSVIRKIASLIPSKKIYLNKPVREVFWYNENYDRIEITCADSSVITAKYVICTISLGCLKEQANVMFKPDLPRRTIDSIYSIGFGTIGKIIIQFENNWWGDARGFQVTWNKNNENNEYAGHNGWLRHMSGFDVVTVGPPNTMIGWVTDKGVRSISRLPLETIQNDVIGLLMQITKRQSLPKVKLFKRSMWDTNQYTRGCYSHVTRACDEFGVGPQTLKEPIRNPSGEPVLYFAGEACHPTHYSTAHGAYNSGYDQTMALLNYLNEERK